jgi:hypothetical protein
MFDDIEAGDAVNIRATSANSSPVVIAVAPVKEHDGMRIVAWTTAGTDVITEDNFLSFVGD